MSGARRTAEALTVTLGQRILVASFREGARAASWAIVRGGIVDADRVAWVEVGDDELGPAVDARAFLAERLSRERLHGAVGLLTSRRLSSHVDVSVHESGVTARAIATVGLGNALRAGDPPSIALCHCIDCLGRRKQVAGSATPSRDQREKPERSSDRCDGKGAFARSRQSRARAKVPSVHPVDGRHRGVAVGTINVLVYVDLPLTDEGLLEANAIATEAKAAALFDAGIASRRTGRPATGTGTDCTVAACPRAARGGRAAYAGKHTPAGAAVGGAVTRAIAAGIRGWRADRGVSHCFASPPPATEPGS